LQDKLQKEVYGLGYPSLPVLSVDEFYDQRLKEGWLPPGSGQKNALQVRPGYVGLIEGSQTKKN